MSRQRIVQHPTIPTEGKFILSDYRNHDHQMYFDGRFIGARRTRQLAQADLDAYVCELLEATAVETADLAALGVAAPPALAPALADALRARGLTVEPKAIGGVWIHNVDLARNKLPCSDLAAQLIVADLAIKGLRLVGTDEAGWCYRLPGGATAWVQGVV